MSDDDTLYVPTDAKGVEYYMEQEFRWPLPARRGVPGEWVSSEDQSGDPAVAGLPLFSLDGLLDDLGERIFRAEIAPGSGAERGERGVVLVDSGRIVAATAWDLRSAASFAIECAEHVLGEASGVRLRSGASLGEVLQAARGWLEHSDGDSGLLGRWSRVASARRLRKRGDEVGDLAFQITVEDEAADVDAFDDPAWEAVASARDAVLAAVEALRHQAAPHVVESENVRYEEDTGSLEQMPEPVGTPWGPFLAGRRAGVVPAWVAAHDAAQRARDAATDANGEEAGEEERAWQRDRLAAALHPSPGPEGTATGGTRQPD